MATMDLDREYLSNLSWSLCYYLCMKKIVSVKDTVVGKYYLFGLHNHTVSNYEVNLSALSVKCIKNELEDKRRPIGWSNRLYIWLQLGYKHFELTGEWNNSAIFCFPDDEHYDKVKLLEITYEQAISVVSKEKEILKDW